MIAPLTEKVSAKLGDFIDIRVNAPEADFWIVRRGAADMVGVPTKSFNSEHFGITVKDRERLVPDYLYYLMLNLHMQGIWQQIATGSTRLVNIRADDIKNIPVA